MSKLCVSLNTLLPVENNKVNLHQLFYLFIFFIFLVKNLGFYALWFRLELNPNNYQNSDKKKEAKN